MINFSSSKAPATGATGLLQRKAGAGARLRLHIDMQGLLLIDGDAGVFYMDNHIALQLVDQRNADPFVETESPQVGPNLGIAAEPPNHIGLTRPPPWKWAS